MKRWIRFALLSLLVFGGPATAASSMTDDQVKAQIFTTCLLPIPEIAPAHTMSRGMGAAAGGGVLTAVREVIHRCAIPAMSASKWSLITGGRTVFH